MRNEAFYSRAEKMRLKLAEESINVGNYQNIKTPPQKNFTLMMNVKHTHLRSHNH